MREISLVSPYEEMDKFGIGQLFNRLRGDGVESMTPLTCQGSRGLGLVVTSEPLDCESYLEYDYVHTLKLVSNDDYYEYICEIEVPKFGDVLDRYAGKTFLNSDIRFTDSGLSLTLVTSQDTIDEITKELNERHDVGNPWCEIKYVNRYSGRANLLGPLTDRQQEVLKAAHAMGYYDIPRQTTSEELAEHLDLEKSTVLEHLRRAEHNLVNHIFDKQERVVGK